MNQANCMCGASHCTAATGLFCTIGANLCSKTPAVCPVTDGSAVNSFNCTCGPNTCDSTTGLFCRSSLYCRKSGGEPLPNAVEVEGEMFGVITYKTNRDLKNIMQDWHEPSKRPALVAKYGNIEDW